MSGVAYDYIEDYIRGLIPDNKPMFVELEQYSEENHVPIIHKEVAQFLKVMLGMQRPKRILELGTAIGYSSMLMCDALNKECEITTVDRSDEMVEIARKNIEKYGFDKNIEIIHNDCEDALKMLAEQGKKYDMIFMDAGKGHYNHFLPYCLEMLEEEGVLISDNVLFKGMIATDKLVKKRKITIARRMRTYLDMISEDKNLNTTVIPMGDGVAVTTRRK